VSEANQRIVVLGEDRAGTRVVLVQPVAPQGEAITRDVAVEEGVGVGAPIMSAPAVSVKGGDSLGVRILGETELQAIEASQAGSSSLVLALHRAKTLGHSG
jgi:hypothetical protein